MLSSLAQPCQICRSHLAKMISLRNFSQSSMLRKAHAVEQVHINYGPVIRVGPNELSHNDLSVLKTIYGPGSGLLKTNLYEMGHFSRHHNMFSTQGPSRHSGIRSLIAKSYPLAALKHPCSISRVICKLCLALIYIVLNSLMIQSPICFS